MSEFAGTGPHLGTSSPNVHESYSFACMRCGHGWEQSYEIEHHVDADGQPYVTYLANGMRVPSPLSRPTCMNCGGHVVRIMRPGRVSSVRRYLGMPEQPTDLGGAAIPTDYMAPKAGPIGQLSAEPPVTVPATAPAAGESTDQGAHTGPEQGAHAGGEAASGTRHWRLSDLLHPFQGRRR